MMYMLWLCGLAITLIDCHFVQVFFSLSPLLSPLYTLFETNKKPNKCIAIYDSKLIRFHLIAKKKHIHSIIISNIEVDFCVTPK